MTLPNNILDVRVAGTTKTFATVYDTELGGPGTLITSNDDGVQLALIEDNANIVADCGVADLAMPGGADDLVLTMDIQHTPAAGINPATDARVLTAWDSYGGAVKWSTTLYTTTEAADSDASDVPGCPGSGTVNAAYLDNDLRDDLSTTTDGQWAVFTYQDFGSCQLECTAVPNPGPWVIQLATGQVRADPDALTAAGNYIFDATFVPPSPTQGTKATEVTLTHPATGQAVSSSEAFPQLDLANRIKDDDGENLPFVVSTDGTKLIAANSLGDQVVKYSLPSLVLKPGSGFPSQSAAWEDGYSYQTKTMLDPATGSIIFSSTRGEVVGIPPDSTPAPPWKVAADDLCGAGSGSVVVIANQQIVTLSATTGQQQSYLPGASDFLCPAMFPSGMGYKNGVFTRYF